MNTAMCVYCRFPVVLADDGRTWLHEDTQAPACRRTVATPDIAVVGAP